VEPCRRCQARAPDAGATLVFVGRPARGGGDLRESQRIEFDRSLSAVWAASPRVPQLGDINLGEAPPFVSGDYFAVPTPPRPSNLVVHQSTGCAIYCWPNNFPSDLVSSRVDAQSHKQGPRTRVPLITCASAGIAAWWIAVTAAFRSFRIKIVRPDLGAAPVMSTADWVIEMTWHTWSGDQS
jgi:hypothetical protein